MDISLAFWPGGGILAVAFIALLEKLVPVGPSTVVFITLGIMLDASPGQLPLAIAIAAAVSGSVAGALIWYALGRVADLDGCRRLSGRVAGHLFLPSDIFDRVARAFHRRRSATIVVAHTIPTVRVFIGLVAGLFRMPLGQFIAAASLGNLLWAAPLMTVGAMPRGSASDPLEIGLYAVGAILAVELALIGAFKFRRRRPPVARPGI